VHALGERRGVSVARLDRGRVQAGGVEQLDVAVARQCLADAGDGRHGPAQGFGQPVAIDDDVAEGEPPTGPQDPADLGEGSRLVRKGAERAFTEGGVELAVVEGQRLGIAADEPDAVP
jgi:hypothetical protein